MLEFFPSLNRLIRYRCEKGIVIRPENNIRLVFLLKIEPVNRSPLSGGPVGDDVVERLRNEFLDRQIAACVQSAGQPGISETERVELLRQQQKLREQKRAPVTPL